MLIFCNNPRRSKEGDRILRKGFLGGVAMAAPFYAEFFSWRWAVLMIVPLLLLRAIYREKVEVPQLALAPLVILLLLHVLALGYTDTTFASQVIKDLIIASFVFVIYILAGDDMLRGFFAALIPLALITALLGLIKAALLDRGYLIGYILDNCSDYPAGSALCLNYNNLGFIWLVAALGCLKSRLWWFLPILLAAGALSSSRRFIVLMVFIPFVWILIQGEAAVAKSLLIAVLSLLLVCCISDSASFERYYHDRQPFQVLSFKSDTQDQGRELVFENINRSAPTIIAGTMVDGTLGTASRLSYWGLGASMLSWFPQGWSYHEVFSCSFSTCSEFHYPHMSIMTEWIIGGVFFGLVAIAFYVWPFVLIWRAKRVLPIALFVVTLPYSLISGDTVFSLPICIACMLVALSSARRRGWKVS
ncbi:hypothetical protein AAGV37_00620 [Pseudomonas protegens]|uniref:hypothetical protein n=1 Tax=Pseudomonas protegens TaxID=380021 RepID=UPI003158AE12